MHPMTACIVATEVLTPYGEGLEACWRGLLANRSAIAPLQRFATQSFHSDRAATIDSLESGHEHSLVMQMLSPMLSRLATATPSESRLLLATTKGEIDLLERAVLSRTGNAAESVPSRLLSKISQKLGLQDPGILISAACASSSIALTRAASWIRSGAADSVLVVACDAVTEFVFSGFSSLMALDPDSAKPFDRNRSGLTVGEAAVATLVMSRERALLEGRPVFGEVLGWGMSDDANHMTGPARDSAGLIKAITTALASSGLKADDIGLIGAHGTGTRYNDEMEMRAFHAIFDSPTPVHSVKGAIGHTMGAAGLVETLIALYSLRQQTAPPTVNLVDADDDATGWVAQHTRPIDSRVAMITNAGFGGINSALVLQATREERS